MGLAGTGTSAAGGLLSTASRMALAPTQKGPSTGEGWELMGLAG